VRDYQGDSTRIYLTGFSYGGNGVLNMGCRQRDVWAALWPVDPTMPPVEGTDQPIWVSAGPHSRVNNSTFRKVWGVQERAPEAPPSPNRVYEDRGLNHVCTAAAAYRDKTIYDWLLTHRQRR
jgi:predicted peptidase